MHSRWTANPFYRLWFVLRMLSPNNSLQSAVRPHLSGRHIGCDVSSCVFMQTHVHRLTLSQTAQVCINLLNNFTFIDLRLRVTVLYIFILSAFESPAVGCTQMCKFPQTCCLEAPSLEVTLEPFQKVGAGSSCSSSCTWRVGCCLYQYTRPSFKVLWGQSNSSYYRAIYKSDRKVSVRWYLFCGCH